MILLADPLELDLATDQVAEDERAVVRHVEADDALAAFGLEASLVGGRVGHPAAAVDKGTFFGFRGGTLGLNLLGRGVIAISEAAVQKFIDCLLISRHPL